MYRFNLHVTQCLCLSWVLAKEKLYSSIRQPLALRILICLPFAPPEELKPPPPQSRRNTLSCLQGAEPGILLSASASDSISIIPSSEAASQLSSPAAGPGRSDTSGCHGRRGMMQAIKNERRASKVRIKTGAKPDCLLLISEKLYIVTAGNCIYLNTHLL